MDSRRQAAADDDPPSPPPPPTPYNDMMLLPGTPGAPPLTPPPGVTADTPYTHVAAPPKPASPEHNPPADGKSSQTAPSADQQPRPTTKSPSPERDTHTASIPKAVPHSASQSATPSPSVSMPSKPSRPRNPPRTRAATAAAAAISAARTRSAVAAAAAGKPPVRAIARPTPLVKHSTRERQSRNLKQFSPEPRKSQQQQTPAKSLGSSKPDTSADDIQPKPAEQGDREVSPKPPTTPALRKREQQDDAVTKESARKDVDTDKDKDKPQRGRPVRAQPTRVAKVVSAPAKLPPKEIAREQKPTSTPSDEPWKSRALATRSAVGDRTSKSEDQIEPERSEQRQPKPAVQTEKPKPPEQSKEAEQPQSDKPPAPVEEPRRTRVLATRLRSSNGQVRRTDVLPASREPPATSETVSQKGAQETRPTASKSAESDLDKSKQNLQQSAPSPVVASEKTAVTVTRDANLKDGDLRTAPGASKSADTRPERADLKSSAPKISQAAANEASVGEGKKQSEMPQKLQVAPAKPTLDQRLPGQITGKPPGVGASESRNSVQPGKGSQAAPGTAESRSTPSTIGRRRTFSVFEEEDEITPVEPVQPTQSSQTPRAPKPKPIISKPGTSFVEKVKPDAFMRDSAVDEDEDMDDPGKDPDAEVDQDQDSHEHDSVEELEPLSGRASRTAPVSRRVTRSQTLTPMRRLRRFSELPSPTQKPPPPPPPPPRRKKKWPSKGDQVRVLWHVDNIYYEGVIDSILNFRGKKFYDITYDSAEREYYVDFTVRKWRFLEGDQGSDDEDIMDEDEEPLDMSKFPKRDDKVMVQWHVDRKYYPGVVRDVLRVNQRLFHDITYDKGDEEFFLDLRIRKWHYQNKLAPADGTDLDEPDKYTPSQPKAKKAKKSKPARKSTRTTAPVTGSVPSETRNLSGRGSGRKPLVRPRRQALSPETPPLLPLSPEPLIVAKSRSRHSMPAQMMDSPPGLPSPLPSPSPPPSPRAPPSPPSPPLMIGQDLASPRRMDHPVSRQRGYPPVRRGSTSSRAPIDLSSDSDGHRRKEYVESRRRPRGLDIDAIAEDLVERQRAREATRTVATGSTGRIPQDLAIASRARQERLLMERSGRYGPSPRKHQEKPLTDRSAPEASHVRDERRPKTRVSEIISVAALVAKRWARDETAAILESIDTLDRQVVEIKKLQANTENILRKRSREAQEEGSGVAEDVDALPTLSPGSLDGPFGQFKDEVVQLIRKYRKTVEEREKKLKQQFARIRDQNTSQNKKLVEAAKVIETLNDDAIPALEALTPRLKKPTASEDLASLKANATPAAVDTGSSSVRVVPEAEPPKEGPSGAEEVDSTTRSLRRKLADLSTRSNFLEDEVKRLQAREKELMKQKEQAMENLTRAKYGKTVSLETDRLPGSIARNERILKITKDRTGKATTSLMKPAPSAPVGMVKKGASASAASRGTKGTAIRHSGRANRKNLPKSNNKYKPPPPPIPRKPVVTEKTRRRSEPIRPESARQEPVPQQIARQETSQQPVNRQEVVRKGSTRPGSASTPMEVESEIPSVADQAKTSKNFPEQLGKQMDKQAAELLALIVTVWLLQDEGRSEPPKRLCEKQDRWVETCVKSALKHAVDYLSKCSGGIMSAKRKLVEDMDGEVVGTSWISSEDDTIIEGARSNYKLWDPPLLDVEWKAEKRVLKGLNVALRTAMRLTTAGRFSATIMYAREIAHRALMDFDLIMARNPSLRLGTNAHPKAPDGDRTQQGVASSDPRPMIQPRLASAQVNAPTSTLPVQVQTTVSQLQAQGPLVGEAAEAMRKQMSLAQNSPVMPTSSMPHAIPSVSLDGQNAPQTSGPHITLIPPPLPPTLIAPKPPPAANLSGQSNEKTLTASNTKDVDTAKVRKDMTKDGMEGSNAESRGEKSKPDSLAQASKEQLSGKDADKPPASMDPKDPPAKSLAAAPGVSSVTRTNDNNGTSSKPFLTQQGSSGDKPESPSETGGKVLTVSTPSDSKPAPQTEELEQSRHIVAQKDAPVVQSAESAVAEQKLRATARAAPESTPVGKAGGSIDNAANGQSSAEADPAVGPPLHTQGDSLPKGNPSLEVDTFIGPKPSSITEGEEQPGTREKNQDAVEARAREMSIEGTGNDNGNQERSGAGTDHPPEKPTEGSQQKTALEQVGQPPSTAQSQLKQGIDQVQPVPASQKKPAVKQARSGSVPRAKTTASPASSVEKMSVGASQTSKRKQSRANGSKPKGGKKRGEGSKSRQPAGSQQQFDALTHTPAHLLGGANGQSSKKKPPASQPRTASAQPSRVTTVVGLPPRVNRTYLNAKKASTGMGASQSGGQMAVPQSTLPPPVPLRKVAPSMRQEIAVQNEQVEVVQSENGALKRDGNPSNLLDSSFLEPNVSDAMDISPLKPREAEQGTAQMSLPQSGKSLPMQQGEKHVQLNQNVSSPPLRTRRVSQSLAYQAAAKKKQVGFKSIPAPPRRSSGDTGQHSGVLEIRGQSTTHGQPFDQNLARNPFSSESRQVGVSSDAMSGVTHDAPREKNREGEVQGSGFNGGGDSGYTGFNTSMTERQPDLVQVDLLNPPTPSSFPGLEGYINLHDNTVGLKRLGTEEREASLHDNAVGLKRLGTDERESLPATPSDFAAERAFNAALNSPINFEKSAYSNLDPFSSSGSRNLYGNNPGGSSSALNHLMNPPQDHAGFQSNRGSFQPRRPSRR